MEELTSIIIVTRNNLEYTRDCLRSINQYTPEPYELILVDNASTDGSVDTLRGVPHAQVISMAEEKPLAACINRALEDAIGDYVLLLDPACYVTEGWLGRLIAGLNAEPRAGAAGPLTNVSLSNPQQDVDPTYSDLQGIATFAATIASSQAGQFENVQNLSLFCFLMTQEVMEKVGGLDEALTVFAGQDYSLRIRMNQFTVRLVKDVFVHRSYVTPWTDDDIRVDHERFRLKWQKVRESLTQRAEELT